MECITEINLLGYPHVDKINNENAFINRLVELGVQSEGAKSIYESMSEIVNLYNVPFSPILSEVINEVGTENISCEEDKLYVIDKCMLIVTDLFQNTTNKLRERIESELHKRNTIE